MKVNWYYLQWDISEYTKLPVEYECSRTTGNGIIQNVSVQVEMLTIVGTI